MEDGYLIFALVLWVFAACAYGIYDLRNSKYLGNGRFLTWVEEPFKSPIQFIEWLLGICVDFEGKFCVVPWWFFLHYLWFIIAAIAIAGFDAICALKGFELKGFDINLVSPLLALFLLAAFCAAILRSEAKAWRGDYGHYKETQNQD